MLHQILIHDQSWSFSGQYSDVTGSTLQSRTILSILVFVFSVDLLDMTAATSLFDQFSLHDHSDDRLLDVSDMISCITAIFELISEEHPNLVDIPLCIDLVLNWILNVFDK